MTKLPDIFQNQAKHTSAQLLMRTTSTVPELVYVESN